MEPIPLCNLAFFMQNCTRTEHFTLEIYTKVGQIFEKTHNTKRVLERTFLWLHLDLKPREIQTLNRKLVWIYGILEVTVCLLSDASTSSQLNFGKVRLFEVTHPIPVVL